MSNRVEGPFGIDERKCPGCNGYGKKRYTPTGYCAGGHTYECEKCDGTGRLKIKRVEKPTGQEPVGG